MICLQPYNVSGKYVLLFFKGNKDTCLSYIVHIQIYQEFIKNACILFVMFLLAVCLKLLRDYLGDERSFKAWFHQT